MTTHVQWARVGTFGSNSTEDIVLSGAVGSGNSVLVMVNCESAEDAIVSVTDDQSNVYASQGSGTVNGRRIAAFLSAGITNAPDTVTVNYGAGSSNFGTSYDVFEASGEVEVATALQVASQSGGSSPVNVAFTAGSADTLAYGVFNFTANITPTAVSGETLLGSYPEFSGRAYLEVGAGATSFDIGHGGAVIDIGVIVLEDAVSADSTAPTFEAAPAAGTPTTTAVNVTATIDEGGTIYAVAVPDGATAPTSAEVVAGTASGGGAALASGSSAATASTQATISLTGMSPGSAIDIYVAAQDDEATPNVQASPTLVNGVTLHRVGVTLTDINAPAADGLVADDSSVKCVAWLSANFPADMTATAADLDTTVSITAGDATIDLSGASGASVGGSATLLLSWDTAAPEQRFYVERGMTLVDLDA